MRWPSPRRSLSAAAGILALATLTWWLWSPYAATEQRFDRGRNGLWIGHKWYTGLHVRSGEAVGEEELQTLSSTLLRGRIRFAFVHVGPILPEGDTEDRAGALFGELRRRTPETVYLAWLGGLASRLPVDDPTWRDRVIATVERLREEGFQGVHLNIEPLEDHHPGYLELLAGLRERLPRDFVLSHATRRAGPFGLAPGPVGPFAWSRSFYERTMELTDQTVLMAYDTKMDVHKHYVAFVKHQTALLVKWGCAIPGHRVLIGIPTYEDVPLYSNPEIENVPNAAQGVRAALEELGTGTDCFDGVAVYANWVTDEKEWADYREHWLDTTGEAFH
ncbi:MAG: hypothetical protein ACQGVK_18095 [Myxococcota bacterium]